MKGELAPLCSFESSISLAWKLNLTPGEHYQHSLMSNRKSSGRNLLFPLPFLMLTAIVGCSVIGDIFKVGFWVGIIFVVVIIAIIFGVISMFRK
jgi:hypothetical protein